MEFGTQLGHYTILSALGKGGMGEVWRARDTKLGREVAIKTLPSAFAKDHDRLMRFEREAKLLAALNHPNIAAIHGFEEDNGTHFLVLELVEGETLAERLAQGSIPVVESLRLALQIAGALEAAHKSDVIHRDLKPGNIKVTPEGKLKVLDFGLAKLASRDSADVNLSNSPTISQMATAQGIILGTAAYMSPEQARGREVDNRTDIWAFGCVLYEMLTGMAPFAGPDVSLTLARVLERKPDFSLLPAGLHPRIHDLLERCLEKDAANRLHDIADARIDIQKVLADPRGVIVEPAVPAARSRRSFLGIAATVAGTAAISGYLGWRLRPSGTPPVSSFSHGLPIGQEFTSTIGSLLTLAPDGRSLVYVANNQLYLRTIDSLESHPIPGTNEVAAAPFFSPDGQQVGYWSAGQLKKIAVGGGVPTTIASAVASIPRGAPFWGADDKIVWGERGAIMRVSAQGGTPEKLIAAEGTDFVHPQLLPGGDAVLFSIAGTSGGIVVQSLKSDARKIRFPGTTPWYLPSGHLVFERDGILHAVRFDAGKKEAIGSPVALVNNVRSNPAQYALSDSGTLIYIPSASTPGNSVLTWVDLKSGMKTPLPMPPKPYRHPRLSRDGTRLAVQTTDDKEHKDIWLYYLDGKTQIQQLAGKGSNSRPIWTRDSKRLTFTSDQGGTESIWWQPADGSGPPEPLTHAEEGLPHWPDSWSPNGGTLAFTKYRQSEQHIWILSLADRAQPKMVAGGLVSQQAGGADFSPDGRWIAYRSNEGRPHIQLQPFPTTGAKYDTAQKDGGSYPVWASKERLIYRRDVQTAGVPLSGVGLVAVDITTDGGPRFGNERTLPAEGMQVYFGSRDYDVTASGDRLIVMFPENQEHGSAAPRPQINVVLNWLEELKKRVSAP
jgi:serine/threonine protein kinase